MVNYNEILSAYLPDKEESEKLFSISERIKKEINDYCIKENINAEAMEVGSLSKKTNLKCSDVDIFILFDKEYSKKYIEIKGTEIGHKILKNGYEKYAEHPYVSGYIDGVKVDIVPAFKIDEGETIVSSVDRTPLHTRFVNSYSNERIIRDIRLLKVFMKLINVYGSEISKSGFSGYLCELLIIKLGSFDNVIKKFAYVNGRLHIPEGVDYEKKFIEPAIIIDPVDPNRNAAAAVSIENLSKMKVASKLFIKYGNMDFIKNSITEEKRKRGTFIKIFIINKPDIIDEIVYPQAVRFKGKIWEIFKNYDFLPVASEIFLGKDIEILIEYERKVLPDMVIHQGPPIDSPEILKFIDIWKNNDRLMRGPYIIGDRIYVDIKRRSTDFYSIFYSNIEKIDIGKNLNALKKNIKIIDVDENTNYEVLKKFYFRSLFD